ncbi:SpoIIIAH-like family protein [Desulfosporosinus fructosivorans]|uniref:SpoIIIAH-like family protein n=1 Tax=Desulfosporosinus fructosivorans TaxID=2018669 RepID=A0A4Z0R446_9FIRM|nr:SpoIIIAH-like family protein [Desulfosporosinus fructosivorans]TGE37812.1 SpoIIIAH-like family protein [Desulfosporosinus fructosivorans]
MFNSRGKRPVILLFGHVYKLWVGGIVSLMVILAALGIWVIKSEPPAYFSRQASLPVNASVEDPPIQFEVETVKENVSGENYFVNYRLKRDQFRQETKAMLSELLNSTVDKSKVQAQEKWLELSTKILKEGEVENLLKMKGFQDAVADVFPENVTVIVYAPSLTPNEVSHIQDIVVRVTKVRLDKITISARK